MGEVEMESAAFGLPGTDEDGSLFAISGGRQVPLAACPSLEKWQGFFHKR